MTFLGDKQRGAAKVLAQQQELLRRSDASHIDYISTPIKGKYMSVMKHKQKL